MIAGDATDLRVSRHEIYVIYLKYRSSHPLWAWFELATSDLDLPSMVLKCRKICYGSDTLCRTLEKGSMRCTRSCSCNFESVKRPSRVAHDEEEYWDQDEDSEEQRVREQGPQYWL